MSEADTATPVKLRLRGEDVGIATPSGGLIFNPFHKDVMSRLGHVTFSPGIFTYTPSSIESSSSSKATPSRANAVFTLSPDTQGDLFPADIDENPILQLKLQEKLNTEDDPARVFAHLRYCINPNIWVHILIHFFDDPLLWRLEPPYWCTWPLPSDCDDELQDTIHSFFKSHLVAPSPDRLVEAQPTKSADRKFALPRTSSLLSRATQMQGQRTSLLARNRVTKRLEVGVQTALSVPFDFDLEGLLHRSLNSTAAPASPEQTGDMADPESPDEMAATRFREDFDDSFGSLSSSTDVLQHGGISLTACSVERLPDGAALTGRPLFGGGGPQEDVDPRQAFLCVSCRRVNPLVDYNTHRSHLQRSLSCTSLGQLNENDEEDEDVTTTQTRVDGVGDESRFYQTLAKTCAAMTAGRSGDRVASTRRNSLMDPPPQHSAMCSTYLSDNAAVALPEEDYEEVILSSPMLVGDLTGTGNDHGYRHLGGGLYSSPSPPLANNQMEYSINPDLVSTSASQSPCTALFDRPKQQQQQPHQQRMLIWSPTVFSHRRTSMSFQSPDLSPILPASRGKLMTSPECNLLFDVPAVRLFGSPEGQLSPVTSPGFRFSSPSRGHHVEDEVLDFENADTI